MSARNHSGFTLVELLVILAMLATLGGLLVPAVHRVRESAERTQCVNNLKMVTLACHDYAASHNNSFPSNPDLIDGRFGTTQDFLQPYME
jgi:competence protein ComGC